MSDFPKRDAIPRARFFLKLAKQCPIEKRDEFEAYLDASIIFGRTALHRFKTKYKRHSNWKTWWDSIATNPAVEFFRKERNWILKDGPLKSGQKIGVGEPLMSMASELYYYENPQTPITDTVEKHLNAIETLLEDAESDFSKS
ncbi:hypothetical protein ES708_20787 [subsurface metagenome]